MVIRKNDMPVKSGKMRDGDGEIIQTTMVTSDKMIHARLFNKFIIKKGCSIGYHSHEKEVEYYYILSGEGIITDNKEDKIVCEGDVTITGWGEGHSIRNEKDKDLVVIAFISTEA